MTYMIERRKNPPLYIVTLHNDFKTDIETPELYSELVEQLEQDIELHTIIIDVLQYDLKLDALLSTTKNILNMDKSLIPFQHRNSKQMIMVTDNPMLKLSMDGFQVFGVIKKFHVAKTLEEALKLV